MAHRSAAAAAGQSARWGDAYRLLAAAARDDLSIDDLDLLGTAAFLTGHDADGIAAWSMAFRRCAGDGDDLRAARIGLQLARCLGFKGDFARASGWAERITDLLGSEESDTVEHGYLQHLIGMGRLLGQNDPGGAIEHFVRAGKIGAHFRQPELIALAGIAEGRMAIYARELDRGMSMLDQAVVSIEAAELGALNTGDAYCTVIDACAELQDFARCRSWSESFVQWCDSQQELVLYRGHCFIHRAEVIRDLGEWPAALAEATRACNRLVQPPLPSALAGASVLEGDLHRLLGNLATAQHAYDRATDLGAQPQPGLALLRLAEGRTDAAHTMMRRVLGESADPISRAKLLGAGVEIALAATDPGTASVLAEEFRAIAGELGTPLLRARAERASALVALAAGDASTALILGRASFTTAHELGVRFDAALARLVVAEACTALGDLDTAATEGAIAHRELEALKGSGDSATDAESLTARELEVLRLVARGHTNRNIAAQLFISEKTVSTHLSHIFTKLGVTTRAAATAYAYERGLHN